MPNKNMVRITRHKRFNRFPGKRISQQTGWRGTKHHGLCTRHVIPSQIWLLCIEAIGKDLSTSGQKMTQSRRDPFLEVQR
jgi:hypothetical protein